jgi:transposase-like protein
MPLSNLLRCVDLTFNCPHCGHPLLKNGSWFMSAPGFKCLGCHRQVRITYTDKVALFGKHTRLAESAR